MENTTLILSVAAAAAASLTALIELIKIFRKHYAETALRKTLIESYAEFTNKFAWASEQIGKQRESTSESISAGVLESVRTELLRDPPDPEIVLKTKRAVEALVDNLEQSEQKEIHEALGQPSLRGQANYLAKILGTALTSEEK